MAHLAQAVGVDRVVLELVRERRIARIELLLYLVEDPLLVL